MAIFDKIYDSSTYMMLKNIDLLALLEVETFVVILQQFGLNIEL